MPYLLGLILAMMMLVGCSQTQTKNEANIPMTQSEKQETTSSSTQGEESATTDPNDPLRVIIRLAVEASYKIQASRKREDAARAAAENITEIPIVAEVSLGVSKNQYQRSGEELETRIVTDCNKR